jgi:hypothetical protein
LYNKKRKNLSIDKENNGGTCRFVDFGKLKLLMASVLSGAKHGKKNPNESWGRKSGRLDNMSTTH